VLEKLFVYRTLEPNRPNEHMLTAVGGCWKTVAGILRDEDSDAEQGYSVLTFTRIARKSNARCYTH